MGYCTYAGGGRPPDTKIGTNTAHVLAYTQVAVFGGQARFVAQARIVVAALGADSPKTLYFDNRKPTYFAALHFPNCILTMSYRLM